MKEIVLSNTLTKRKEPFTPISENKVGMYVCGVTVYDKCHLGHGRSAVAFDVINRYLRYKGYQVTFVRNITDIDDKIIQKAQNEGVEYTQITKKYIEEFNRDMNMLNIMTPEVEPKATEHIQEMISIIATLIRKDHAYNVEGNVYFDVGSFPEYGKLSGKKIEELEDVGRIEHEEGKKNVLDFALWKRSKENEPFWESPWGKGRPGWHIECSAMGKKYLGEQFDIHGGGMDLIFPHHENEITQSEASSGKKFVNYWLHNGFVTIDKTKMSKSLGNFFTLEEIFRYYPPEAVRYFFLLTQYKHPVDFSLASLENAYIALGRIYHHIDWFQRNIEFSQEEINNCKAEEKVPQFFKALDDDLNTAAAVASLNSLLGKINKAKKEGNTAEVKENTFILLFLGNLLGLFYQGASNYFNYKKEEHLQELGVSEEWISEKLDKRKTARENKDWNLSDTLRDELLAKKIKIMDLQDETVWRIDAASMIKGFQKNQ